MLKPFEKVLNIRRVTLVSNLNCAEFADHFA